MATPSIVVANDNALYLELIKEVLIEKGSPLLMKVYPIGASMSSAAHIPDLDGYPLCRTKLNLVNWAVQDRDAAGMIVCNRCRNRARQSRSIHIPTFDTTAPYLRSQ
jgi:hypothetical protein